MKNISRLSLAVIAMFLVMAFTSINAIRYTDPIELSIKPAEIVTLTPEFEIIELEIPANRHVDFLQAIGHKESGNNYNVVNTFGYMGKYQFGKSSLKGLGYDVSKEEFLSSPDLQEEAIRKLLKANKKVLRRQIKKFDGKLVNGILVTESGLLAAAHLAGPGNVKKFFRKGYEFHDGNGTKMTSYMVMFSDYKLEF